MKKNRKKLGITEFVNVTEHNPTGKLTEPFNVNEQFLLKQLPEGDIKNLKYGFNLII